MRRGDGLKDAGTVLSSHRVSRRGDGSVVSPRLRVNSFLNLVAYRRERGYCQV